jgi:enamine deaminase RidA (YjgF/YER057c/UK114 family)
MTDHPPYENPSTVAAPLGAYSHVARAGDLLFVAGQVGVKPDGTLAGSDVAPQLRQTLENIAAVLESVGATMRDIVKFTTYLTSADHIAPFFAARDDVFRTIYPDGEYPPNTLLVIDRLVSPDLELEIEAIAHGPNRQP